MSDFICAYQERAEMALSLYLPSGDDEPCRLHQAMTYSVLNGGKRIRPLLVYAVGLMLGASNDSLDAPAAAVEIIHSYSLIHDDLPPMDNDDLRRGKPTCHKAFDEATAILAGDALQAHAFYVLADNEHLTEKQRVKMLIILTEACGSLGMAGGQAIDLESVGKALTLTELENMHRLKTGALIRASVLLGAVAGNADAKTFEILTQFAELIGLAFQIQDDILDVEGETALLGKQAGADQTLNKPTYPSMLGLQSSKEKMQYVYEAALNTLKQLDFNTAWLYELAAYMVERDR
jgi:farnesyl diphosphate synthase